MSEQDISAAVIREARSWLGTPYRHQASVKSVGCDCLGLVRGVWRALYGEEPEAVPAYDAGWAEAGRREQLADAAKRHMEPLPLSELCPGALLLFRWRAHMPAKHLAIASYDGQMIHAQENARVCEVPLSPWWCRRIAFVFAFPEKT